MSENGTPNQEGRPSPDKVAQDTRAPRARPNAKDLKEAGENTRDRIASGQDEAVQALGAYRDEGYEPADLEARDAANTEAGLRGHMSEAAGAIRERTSESARHVRERAAGTYDEARSWASDRYDHQRRRTARLARRGYGKVRQGRRAAEDFVQENPLLVGVVGLAAGLLLGALLPRTRQEDRTIGPWADEAREHGIRYARDVTQRGREFVVSALDPDNLEAAARHRHDSGLSQDSDFPEDERPAHRL